MEPQNVMELIRPFDPTGIDAEAHYDAVVRRVNQVRAKRAHNARERTELERQFIEGDLRVSSGARKGAPLSTPGRKKRLARLIDLGVEDRRLAAEELFAVKTLDHMNAALDRWARETYGA